jgi:hypothetical protein
VDLVRWREAVEILGVSAGCVAQLADADLIPFIEIPTPKSVRRKYRRDQLEVVANARDASIGEIRSRSSPTPATRDGHAGIRTRGNVRSCR